MFSFVKFYNKPALILLIIMGLIGINALCYGDVTIYGSAVTGTGETLTSPYVTSQRAGPLTGTSYTCSVSLYNAVTGTGPVTIFIADGTSSAPTTSITCEKVLSGPFETVGWIDSGAITITLSTGNYYWFGHSQGGTAQFAARLGTGYGKAAPCVGSGDFEPMIQAVARLLTNDEDTPTPTDTPTNSPTNTPTDSPTKTPTNTPTDTPTNSPTTTPTNTPTHTATVTYTNTKTHTITWTPYPTSGQRYTNTPDRVYIINTWTPTPTITFTGTWIPTETFTPTNTNAYGLDTSVRAVETALWEIAGKMVQTPGYAVNAWLQNSVTIINQFTPVPYFTAVPQFTAAPQFTQIFPYPTVQQVSSSSVMTSYSLVIPTVEVGSNAGYSVTLDNLYGNHAMHLQLGDCEGVSLYVRWAIPYLDTIDGDVYSDELSVVNNGYAVTTSGPTSLVHITIYTTDMTLEATPTVIVSGFHHNY